MHKVNDLLRLMIVGYASKYMGASTLCTHPQYDRYRSTSYAVARVPSSCTRGNICGGGSVYVYVYVYVYEYVYLYVYVYVYVYVNVYVHVHVYVCVCVYVYVYVYMYMYVAYKRLG